MNASIDSAISLPQAAPIPGLHFRPYAGPNDIPAVVELYRRVNAAHGVTEAWTVEQERVEIENTSHVDPTEDFILAFVADQLVAASSIEWSDTTEGQRLYRSRGWLLLDWARRGIGTAMLARNESRLRELASAHDHDRPPMLTTFLEDGDVGGHALFAARGYRNVRIYHHMVRPDMEGIEITPLPDGLEARPITQDMLPQVWEAMTEAFRDHFGGRDHSAEAFRRWSEDPSIDLDLWAVAFDRDEMAGGVLGYIEARENELQGYLRGWTDPVFTRRPWRRKGVARALLGRCLAQLKVAGMTSAQLEVDTENANDAVRLYRDHRFEHDRGSSEWHKPLRS